MSGAGAELGLVIAQPGFHHQQQSSTNGLACQHQQNATKEGEMTEKQESSFTLHPLNATVPLPDHGDGGGEFRYGRGAAQLL
jgi:hypothetical protein